MNGSFVCMGGCMLLNEAWIHAWIYQISLRSFWIHLCMRIGRWVSSISILGLTCRLSPIFMLMWWEVGGHISALTFSVFPGRIGPLRDCHTSFITSISNSGWLGGRQQRRHTRNTLSCSQWLWKIRVMGESMQRGGRLVGAFGAMGGMILLILRRIHCFAYRILKTDW